MMGPRPSRRRDRLLRRAAVPAAVILCCAMLVVAGAVQAALPPTGSSFTFHDHATAGNNWHVEFKIDGQDRRKIKTLVVYSERCNATVAKVGVPISDAGVIAAAGGLDGGGTWALDATFKESTTLVGTMRITRAGCDTGVLSYPNAITGDGHTDHSHAGDHGHAQKYPDFGKATARQRRHARALHRRVLKKWRGVTVAKAARLGFLRSPKFTRRTLGMFHTYNRRYEGDKRRLDPRRPESLVFWRPAQGEPVILGAMFRVSPGKPPAVVGSIPPYHTHGKGKPTSQMTHVWMVKGPRSAFAACLPVKQLELYNPAFKWTAGWARHEHIGDPC